MSKRLLIAVAIAVCAACASALSLRENCRPGACQPGPPDPLPVWPKAHRDQAFLNAAGDDAFSERDRRFFNAGAEAARSNIRLALARGDVPCR